MSLADALEPDALRAICQPCRERKAALHRAGAMGSNREGTLCFECYRLARNCARFLDAGSDASTPDRPPQSPFGRGSLTPREIAHRSRMLEQLKRASGR